MNITVAAVGTRGDVEPHSAFCRGLMQAGYSVKLCAPVDFAAAAGARGIPFHAIPVSFRNLIETQGGDTLLASDANGIRFLHQLRRLAKGVAEPVIASIREACQGADCVCYSPLGLPAQFFAREMRIPSIATYMQPIGRTAERPSPLFALPRRTPGIVNAATHLLLEALFWQLVRPLMRPHVGETLPLRGYFGNTWRSGNRSLFAYSPAVVPTPGDWKPWMHVTGYWSSPREMAWRPPDSLADFLSGGPPPVCIGFGSMNSSRIDAMLDTALQVLAETGRRGIILTGWSGRLTGNAGGDSVYITDSAPHDWLFPRVASVIHHGGAGTTAAALRAGVVSVILPFFFDQAFWGRWLEARGLGPAPIPFRRLSTPGLRRALEAAEAPDGMRCRVLEVSRRLRGEDGVGNAVAVIRSVLQGSARAARTFA